MGGVPWALGANQLSGELNRALGTQGLDVLINLWVRFCRGSMSNGLNFKLSVCVKLLRQLFRNRRHF